MNRYPPQIVLIDGELLQSFHQYTHYSRYYILTFQNVYLWARMPYMYTYDSAKILSILNIISNVSLHTHVLHSHFFVKGKIIPTQIENLTPMNLF